MGGANIETEKWFLVVNNHSRVNNATAKQYKRKQLYNKSSFKRNN